MTVDTEISVHLSFLHQNARQKVYGYGKCVVLQHGTVATLVDYYRVTPFKRRFVTVLPHRQNNTVKDQTITPVVLISNEQN